MRVYTVGQGILSTVALNNVLTALKDGSHKRGACTHGEPDNTFQCIVQISGVSSRSLVRPFRSSLSAPPSFPPSAPLSLPPSPSIVPVICPINIRVPVTSTVTIRVSQKYHEVVCFSFWLFILWATVSFFGLSSTWPGHDGLSRIFSWIRYCEPFV